MSSRIWLVFSLLVFTCLSLHAQKIWKGTSSDAWNEPSNWEPTGVPGVGDNVLIDFNQYRFTGPAPATDGYGITLAAGDTLTITVDAELSIDGGLAISDGLALDGVVDNHGTLSIRNCLDDGVQLNQNSVCTNHETGFIAIDSSNYGIYTQGASSSFTNQGMLRFGENGRVALRSLLQGSASSSIVNDTCAVVHAFDNSNVSGGSVITNAGVIYQASSIGSTIFENTGTIYSLGTGSFTVNNGISALTTLPDTNRWIGVEDDDWHTPCNWDSQIYPLASQEVIVPDSANYPNILDRYQGYCKSLLVQSGGRLRVNNNGRLTINGKSQVDHCIRNLGNVDFSGDSEVSLDSSLSHAIETSSNLTSFGDLTIGQEGVSGSVGGAGIHSTAILVLIGGSTKIFETTGHGIENDDGTIFLIGDTMRIINCNSTAVMNRGNEFSLERTNAVLIIDSTTNGLGIENDGSPMFNVGQVFISNTASHGIACFNSGSLQNMRDIDISDAGIDGIICSNNGSVVNEESDRFDYEGFGQIHIQNSNNSGIACFANSSVTNKSGSTININTTKFFEGIALSQSQFSNSGFININDIRTHGIDVRSTANFNNNGGTIHISNTQNNGVRLTAPSALFTNTVSASLQIDTASVHGILMQDGDFFNYGNIEVDSATQDGVQLLDSAIFTNSGATLSISRSGFSGFAVVGEDSKFVNTSEAQFTSRFAKNNGLYSRGRVENLSSSSMVMENPAFTTIYQNFTGSLLNDDCSSIVGNKEVFIDPGCVHTNNGMYNVSSLIINGTFDNTNGYVFDASGGFDCSTMGGTCLSDSLVHIQFTSDNDNDGTSFCEGDIDDLNCPSTTNKIVSNSLDDGIGSLRWIMACAQDGDTIGFAPATNSVPLDLFSSTLVIDHDLHFQGNGTTSTVIDGGNADDQTTISIIAGKAVSFNDMRFTRGGGENFNGFGGMVASGGQVNIKNCEFEHNEAANGGCIFSSGIMQITNSTFHHNKSMFQAGCIQNQGTLELINSLFYENQAGTWGGTIINLGSTDTLNVYNCTFAENRADLGGAILDFGVMTLSNTLFSSNSANSTGPNIWNSNNAADEFYHNYIDDTTSSRISLGTDGNITGTDIYFVDTALNDYRLRYSSPALNAGNSSYLPLDLCDLDEDGNTAEALSLDIREKLRIHNDTLDIGAFENSVHSVTFRVDMNRVSGRGNVDGTFRDEAFLGEDFSGSFLMSDPEGDRIWEFTARLMDVVAGSSYKYLFAETTNSSSLEFAPGECSDYNSAESRNERSFEVNSYETVLPVVCYEECFACNDECDYAQIVECGDTVRSSTTSQNSAPDLICNISHLANGLWYELVGTGGIVTVSTISNYTDYDTRLAIFRADCDEPICVTENDDFGTLQSSISFGTAKDTSYYIYVNGFDMSAGEFELTVNCADPCPETLALGSGFGPMAGTYTARDSITMTQFIRQFEGIELILDAPVINIEATTDIPVPNRFETKSDGCEND